MKRFCLSSLLVASCVINESEIVSKQAARLPVAIAFANKAYDSISTALQPCSSRQASHEKLPS